MFDVTKKSIEWGEETLTLETGKVARQADGTVIATLGETSVMANVTFARAMKEGQDFFPLTVHYQEKYYAAGKIPGGFFKREARPSEAETLTARLIDRPIRPLFVEGFKHEVLVMCTVLSHDLVNSPDVVAMIAASAALTLSGVPFMGPIAAARVGFENGDYILNPTVDDMQGLKNNPDQRLDLVVAGTKDAVMMVESEAYELSEEEMLGAVTFAHKQIQPIIDLIIDLAEDCAKEPFNFEAPDFSKLLKNVKKIGEKKMRSSFAITDKQERQLAVAETRDYIKSKLSDEELEDPNLGSAMKKLEAGILRGDVVKGGKRIDGRATTDIRQIVSETGLLPRTHGSALFTRGETQALVVTTLGTGDDEQIIDALHGNFRSNFLLHYNFPPYSVGEVGRVGATGRREIGHGKLAWRALQAVLPAATDFPYTIRVVSEITESNGSSSMASVCGGSLAMMDAGVPLKSPVAGVAMGLILEEDGTYAVLTDILGDEDHLGDMDFKVTGTADGITACQMDIKVKGLSYEILVKALKQARDGRLHILDKLTDTIAVPAQDVKPHAPKMVTRIIPNEFIGALIGPGGKVIQELQKETGTTIVINEDPVTEEGIVEILGTDQDGIDAVLAKIDSILFKPEVGSVYEVKVIKMLDFGAVVEYLEAPGNEVLLHVSELAWERTENVSDVVNMGDVFDVKYFGVDSRTRKEKVSRKALLPKPEGYVERPPRDRKPNNRGRDNRRNDRKPRRD
jgi:polyribonucleotide nucleotidyltransferase